jgi:Fur family transcriptional regulator, stress-responsive regulator
MLLSGAGSDYIGLRKSLDSVQYLAYIASMPSDPSDLLRQHGLQVTAQRLAVLRAVSRRPHRTADEIAEEARANIGAISRQAVYDTLGILVEKGVIRRIQPAQSPALYEDRVGDHHHHVICRLCGTTADVDCVLGEAHCSTAAASSGFQIDEAEVIYWGTCPECLAKSAEAGDQTPG